MLSCKGSDDENAMVITDQPEGKNDDVASPKSWIDDMKCFLVVNGYPKGLDRKKRRQYRL